MLKEVIIVEGKSDIAAVKRAIDADCIATGGFHLTKNVLKTVSGAYNRRGIIILTDPDSAGENIRNFLSKNFPNAKHAHISREEGTFGDDIGVENASPEAIRNALAKVHTLTADFREEFTVSEMISLKISGSEDSSRLRDKISAILGVGYCNTKTFVRRLNAYGVTHAEFTEALACCTR